MKFTIEEFIARSKKSGCKDVDFTSKILNNAQDLIDRINRLGYKPPKYFSSCLRSKEKQIQIYKDKGITDINKIPMKSAHLTGQAVDIADDGSLQQWLLEHETDMGKCGLYAEDFRYTKSWCHLQSVAPKSKKRFFIP